MLTTEQKQTFAEEGYFVFKELFPKALMEEILCEANIIANHESPTYEEQGIVQFWDSTVFVRYSAFLKALEYPPFEKLRESVSSDFRMMTGFLTSGLVLIPSGQGLIDWHRDSDYADVSGFHTNRVVAIIYLQDTRSSEVGPMRVLPASQKSDYLNNHNSYFGSIAGQVELAFSSGTVILFQENLWHIAGPNNSDRDYWLLNLYYGRPKAS